MDLDDVILVFRRRWRIVALGALVAFPCLALAVTSIPIRYRSECKVLCMDRLPEGSWPASILEPGILGDRVARRLRLLGHPSPPDGASIAAALEVKDVEGTGYLCLAVSGPDPAGPERLLNLLVEEASLLLAEKSPSGGSPRPALVPIQLATLAERQGPSTRQLYAAAAGVSVLIGGVLALAREGSDGRVHSALDLRRLFGLPTLAAIPREGAGGKAEGRGRGGRLLPEPDGVGIFDSAARTLLQKCDGARTLILASAGKAPGGTSLAAALADALVRRGISAAVLGEGGALEEAAASHDIVLIDSEPLRRSCGTLALAPRVDGVILVARAGVTRWSDLARARRRVEEAGGNILGALLDGADPSEFADHRPGRSVRPARKQQAAGV